MTTRSSLMREDDRTGVSQTRPDRHYRMPPCPIHSQFRVVGHDLGGTTHRTCPLSDFEPRSTWLKGATWEIPVGLLPLLPVTPDVDRPSTFQARFSDCAGRCARAFGLGEVGFYCCQAGWRTGIRLQLRRIGGRAVAGARPARIRRVVRRCRGSRRVGGARRCRAGLSKAVAVWRRRFQRNTNSSR